MSRANPRTSILGLPLNVAGIVALQNSVKRGFELIDAAVGALQSGTGLTAAEIAYDSGNPGDSNSSATTVAGALDDIYAQLNVLNVRTDSNSQG